MRYPLGRDCELYFPFDDLASIAVNSTYTWMPLPDDQPIILTVEEIKKLIIQVWRDGSND